MSEPDKKGSKPSGGKLGVLIGLLAALALGGGGFYATYAGLIGGGTEHTQTATDSHNTQDAGHAQTEFVPLTPLVVSLGRGATNRYLRFSAELEVNPSYKEEVTSLQPRVLDVLNGYLRAVDSRDIETPSSLGRLRAQMLRRVQVVTGADRVRDLLITEFVLN